MAEERLEEIRQNRIDKRAALIKEGSHPYPSEVRRTHTIKEALDNFDTLKKESTPVILAGRIKSIRRHGGLIFIDLADMSGGIQLQITKDEVDAVVFEKSSRLDSGDWIQATGLLGTTKRGVNTLMLTTFHVLSKAIRPLPDAWFGLKDHETRFRQREVDLLLNPEVRDVFKKRSKIIAWLRQYLNQEEFMEVETPVLQPIAGGAIAKPFTTHHNALDIPLYLRIAPELYLKRLIVGGYEKVFEIARNFRNEGISKQHNPEFTMLEFYWAYADYEDLMDMTEKMLAQLVKDITGSTEITWQDNKLSFTTPMKRARYVDIVSERIGINILEEKNIEPYIEVFKKEGLEIPKAPNYVNLVDELYKELVRPNIMQPTIIFDYPVEMLPLAKQSQSDKRIAEAFQFLVCGSEIIKAYTELNDPVEQRLRFEEQQAAREEGDEEAHTIDEDYLRAMEYGMPPTAGFGMGIDRLTMLLTDSPTLRDTIMFPLLKPEKKYD